MPKASCAAKDAVEVSLGIQEGMIEVTGAVVKSHQYPMSKKTGNQSDPFPCVQLTVLRCNDQGERLDAEEEKIELGIGGVSRNDSNDWKFHPGQAEGPDDNDPEDLGIEVDTEGNCIYATSEDAKLNKKCKWMRFATSLEEKGFKPEVLANGYMPDLVGLKAHVKTITLEKMPGAKEDQNAPTALVVDKILQFPYEAKGKGKGKGAAAPASGKGKTAAGNGSAPANGKGASKPEPKGEAVADGDDPDAIAVSTLATVCGEMAGKEGVERKKVQTAVQTKLMRNKVTIKLHKPVMDLVKDDDWMAKVSAEDEDSPVYGKFMLDTEAGTVTFAE